jgi:formate dehydrogenase formation protein
VSVDFPLDGRLDLREAWRDLLRRRPAFKATLAIYGHVIDAWAGWAPPRPLGLAMSAEACRASWEAGTPLVSEAARALRAEDVESLAGDAMESLAHLDPTLGPFLQRLAEAWDEGRVTPAALLPSRGRIGAGAVEQASGLAADAVAFLATAALRPLLQAMFEPVRVHLAEGAWSVGVCPFCGGPPAFTDVIEDGRRRLTCHLCGGAWTFAKLRCPFCGLDGAQHLARFTPEEAREEGYVISGCRECRAYVKELDRRVRWNGGPALVEDWGSPHFDLIARRHGYWRPEGSVILAAAGDPGVALQ